MYKWIILLSLLIFLFTFPDPIPSETGNVEFCFSPQSNCSLFLANTIKEMDACAFYDLDEPTIVNTLQHSAIPTYVDAGTKTSYGIPIYQKGLMHHKFCYNTTHALFGTGNPTQRGVSCNDNLFILVESRFFAENLKTEWNNLRYDSHKKTPHPEILFNGYTLHMFFCPRDNCQEQLLSVIQKANTSLSFYYFTLTDAVIAKELLNKNNTLPVQGIMEASQTGGFSQFFFLNQSGLSVKKDTNPCTMHHKTLFIDNRTVVTGSYNPTKNANTNNRELLVMWEDLTLTNLVQNQMYIN